MAEWTHIEFDNDHRTAKRTIGGIPCTFDFDLSDNDDWVMKITPDDIANRFTDGAHYRGQEMILSLAGSQFRIRFRPESRSGGCMDIAVDDGRTDG